MMIDGMGRCTTLYLSNISPINCQNCTWLVLETLFNAACNRVAIKLTIWHPDKQMNKKQRTEAKLLNFFKQVIKERDKSRINE